MYYIAIVRDENNDIKSVVVTEDINEAEGHSSEIITSPNLLVVLNLPSN